MTELTHLFDLFILWLGAQSQPVLYLVLLLFAVLENLFPPIPGDTVTVFGAFLVGSGKLSFWLVWLSTTAGSVLGFFLLFMLARRLGVEFFERRKLKWLSRENLTSAKRAVGRFGYAAILVNRFLPGIRSAISITAGLLKMPSKYVLPLSFVSAAVWNLIWIAAGSALGKTWEGTKRAVESFVHQYNLIAGVIVCGVIFGAAVWIIVHRRRRRRRRH